MSESFLDVSVSDTLTAAHIALNEPLLDFANALIYAVPYSSTQVIPANTPTTILYTTPPIYVKGAKLASFLSYNQSTGVFTNSSTRNILLKVLYTTIFGSGSTGYRNAYILSSNSNTALNGLRLYGSSCSALGTTVAIQLNSGGIFPLAPGDTFQNVAVHNNSSGTIYSPPDNGASNIMSIELM